jgi:hypothetical protein
MKYYSLFAAITLATGTNAFAGLNQGAEVSRRESFAKVATIFGGVSAGLVLPNVANATPSEETQRYILPT